MIPDELIEELKWLRAERDGGRTANAHWYKKSEAGEAARAERILQLHRLGLIDAKWGEETKKPTDNAWWRLQRFFPEAERAILEAEAENRREEKERERMTEARKEAEEAEALAHSRSLREKWVDRAWGLMTGLLLAWVAKLLNWI